MAYKQKAERPVIEGGSENITFTAYSCLIGGTTSTGPFQDTSGVGSSGDVLTSNGAGSPPSFQTPPIPIMMNFQLLASDPGAPAVGQVWYNTTSGTFKGYNGSIISFDIT